MRSSPVSVGTEQTAKFHLSNTYRNLGPAVGPVSEAETPVSPDLPGAETGQNDAYRA